MFNFLKFLLLLCVFPLIGVAQLSDRQTRNLEAFSKIYGYIRYFHPSDESGIATWDDIAINGSTLMLSVKNDEQLIQELKNIYLPIAPTIKIYPSAEKLKFDVRDITPSDLSNYKEISWQHLGIALYGWEEKRSYYSIKLNRRSVYEQRGGFKGDLIPEMDISKNKGHSITLMFH